MTFLNALMAWFLLNKLKVCRITGLERPATFARHGLLELRHLRCRMAAEGQLVMNSVLI